MSHFSMKVEIGTPPLMIVDFAPTLDVGTAAGVTGLPAEEFLESAGQPGWTYRILAPSAIAGEDMEIVESVDPLEYAAIGAGVSTRGLRKAVSKVDRLITERFGQGIAAQVAYRLNGDTDAMTSALASSKKVKKGKKGKKLGRTGDDAVIELDDVEHIPRGSLINQSLDDDQGKFGTDSDEDGYALAFAEDNGLNTDDERDVEPGANSVDKTELMKEFHRLGKMATKLNKKLLRAATTAERDSVFEAMEENSARFGEVTAQLGF